MKKTLPRLLLSLLLALLATAALQRAYLYRPFFSVSLTAETERPVTFTLHYNGLPLKDAVHISQKPGRHTTVAELRTSRLEHLELSYDTDLAGAVTLHRLALCDGEKESPLAAAESKEAPQRTFKWQEPLRSELICDTPLLLSTFFLLLLLFWKIVTRFPLPQRPQPGLPRGKEAWLSAAFCALFCIILVLPWCRIDRAEVSEDENRALATPPPFFPKGQSFNLHFGRDFEAWFQDRFWQRSNIVYAYTRAVSKADGQVLENGAAVMYRDSGWIFNKEYLNLPAPTQEEQAAYISNLNMLQSFCDTHGIALYLAVMPGKESVYAEENKRALTAPEPVVRQFLNTVGKQCPGLTVVYPCTEMKETAQRAPHTLLHYQTDSHINEDGAYLVAEALTTAMNRRFPDLKLQPKEAFNSTFSNQRFGAEYKNTKRMQEIGPIRGDMERWLMLHRDGYSQQHRYPHYSWEQGGLTLRRNKIPMSIVSHFEDGHRKAVLIGDSTTQYIRLWLHTMFKDMLRLRANNNGEDGNELRMSRWEAQIVRYKPDILIICVGEGTLFRHIATMY